MENTEGKFSVNFAKEFIVYISRNKKSWKKIDELYYKYYDRCIDVKDEVKERIEEYRINIKNETIENICYINKFTSLIILDENCDSVENVMYIVSSAFSKAYKYAISNSIIKLSSFQKRKINVNDPLDDIFSEHLCLLFVAMIYNKKVDEKDEFYLKLVENLYKLNNIENGLIKSGFSHENCNKTRKTSINELELIIRSRYFISGYNAEGVHDFLEVKNCFDDLNDRSLHISKTKDDVYCKMYCSLEYTDNILNKTNARVLFKGIEIKKEVVKDFINAYLILSGYSLNENTKINKEDINLEELSTYVVISIVQALYIEAYDNTCKFFFENYNENINIKYEELLNEDRALKKNNLKLQDENERLKVEIEELKRKLDKTDKELEKFKSNNKELFELRNYIFDNQEDEVDTEENISLEHIKDKKVVCFGGNKAWISNMGKEFDNWTFISAEVTNFNTTILKDVDIVFIKATHISHAMYYKVIANLDDDTEIKFINNNNIDRIKKELSNV